MSYLVYMKEALANLFKPPVTSKYPLEPHQFKAGDRGRVVNDISQCILCGMCERSCPADAIHVDRKNGTWTINPFSCVQCANCVVNCPKKCLTMDPRYAVPDTKKSEVILTVETQAGKKETSRKVEALHPTAMAKALDDRSHVVNNMLKCIFCGMCMRNCPAGAITVDRRTRMWRIDLSACVNCGTCIDNCPRKCLSLGCYLGNKTEITLYGPAPRRPQHRLAPKPEEAGKREEDKPEKREEGREKRTQAAAAPSTPTFQGTVSRVQPEGRENRESMQTARCAPAEKPKPEVRASVNPKIEEPETGNPKPETTVADVPQSDNPTHVRNNIDKCLFCGKCAHNCPVQAITLDRRNRTWTIDREKCVTCGVCVDGCPAHCLTMEDDWADGESRAMVCTLQGKPPVRRPRPAAASKAVEPKTQCAPACGGKVVPPGTKGGALPEEKPPSKVRASVNPKAAAPTQEPRTTNPEPSNPRTIEPSAPESAEPSAQSDNPTHVRNNIDKCLFCGKCAHNCPVQAITLDRKNGTWTIDREKCITCGLCVEGCPAHCLSMEDDWADGESHAMVCTVQGKPPVRRPRPAPKKQ